jgi:hypothetical protein
MPFMSQQFNVIIEQDTDGYFVVHAGDTLGSGILLKILKDCGLTREELQDLL